VPLIPYYLATVRPLFTDDAKAAGQKEPWPPNAVKD